jgi:hypothetical protein
VIEPRKRAAEDVLVKEQESALRLILRRRRDCVRDREVGQKGLDLRAANLDGVTLAVEPDEASNPVHISLLGSEAVVFQANAIAHLTEQAGRSSVCDEASCRLGRDFGIDFDDSQRVFAVMTYDEWITDILYCVVFRLAIFS